MELLLIIALILFGVLFLVAELVFLPGEIGRASCRERV